MTAYVSKNEKTKYRLADSVKQDDRLRRCARNRLKA